MDTFFNVNLVKTLFIDFSCKIRNTVAAKKAPLLAYKKYGKNIDNVNKNIVLYFNELLKVFCNTNKDNTKTRSTSPAFKNSNLSEKLRKKVLTKSGKNVV